MSTTELVEPEPRALTPEEARAFFDRHARRYLNMSGEEFVRRYDAGELDPDDDNVFRVAILLPFGR